MSKFTRRNFLKMFGVVAGAAVVPQLPAPVKAPATTKISISQELLDDAGWEPYCVNSTAGDFIEFREARGPADGDMALFGDALMYNSDGEWIKVRYAD